MTNLYTAIMKAADYIENHPSKFGFMFSDIPTNCGTPGCALGWIAFFLNDTAYTGVHVFARARFFNGLEPHADIVFYARMDECSDGSTAWMDSASECAHVLRLYAAKYHRDEQPTLPDWKAMASQFTVGDKVRSQEVVS